jgi:hypothetical protein
MDPDADLDPAIYVNNLPSRRQQNFFALSIFAYYFLKVHLHHFSKIKIHTEVTKQVGFNVFLTIFAQ